MTSSPDSKHVQAHQDGSKRQSALSIEAQLNCHCGDLAKAAVCEAMFEVPGTSQSYILPLEDLSIFIDDVGKEDEEEEAVAHFTVKAYVQ